VRAGGVDVGLVGCSLALLEAPVQDVLDVQDRVERDLAHVLDLAVREVGLHLGAELGFAHAVQVQLDQRVLLGVQLAARAALRVQFGVVGGGLALLLVDLEFAQVLKLVVVEFHERAADLGLELELYFVQPALELLGAAGDEPDA